MDSEQRALLHKAADRITTEFAPASVQYLNSALPELVVTIGEDRYCFDFRGEQLCGSHWDAAGRWVTNLKLPDIEFPANRDLCVVTVCIVAAVEVYRRDPATISRKSTSDWISTIPPLAKQPT